MHLALPILSSSSALSKLYEISVAIVAARQAYRIDNSDLEENIRLGGKVNTVEHESQCEKHTVAKG